MITVGVDEVGRGCLVGNVVAAAVIFPAHFDALANLPALTDSKKLSAKKRALLAALITTHCRWAVGEASPAEIDEINILQATMLAMRRAVMNLNQPYDRVLVDGNRCPEVKNCRAIVRGDLSEPEISAASIVAKVARDKQMVALDLIYPNYGFAQHKGYGTQRHREALAKFGAIIGQHRFSFAPVRNLAID